MRLALAVILLSIPTIGQAGGSAQAVTSTAADRKAVAVTVYNDNRALVREERLLELPGGSSELRFMGVPEKVEAPTVRVGVIEGGELSVLEQNFEYDLLSPAKLLEKFVGQTITLVQQKMKDNSTVEEEVPARLLSTNNGTVFEIGGKIVANPPYLRIVFPSVPENLIAHPTLVWLVDASGAGKRRLETAYLTGGMGWRADYVLSLDPEETKAALQGWITVDNRSGAAYQDASLKLVAGDVHRAAEDRRRAPTALKATADRDEMVAAESFFEYHLYTLPRPTTLKNNQTKQVRLLNASQIEVAKDFVLRGGGSYYRALWKPARNQEKVQVFLRFKNAPASGLGLALPKGIVRVYKRDRQGSPQFVGEDRIDHTPKDETVKLEMGNAFDISAERKQTDYRVIASNLSESAYEIRLRNHKEVPITVQVQESLSSDWTMLSSSHPFTKTQAFEVEFPMTVAPDQEVVLTYRVRVTW